jgi:hypothetical protein
LANTGPVNDEKGLYNAGDSAWGQPAGIVSALRHQRALWVQVAQSDQEKDLLKVLNRSQESKEGVR